MYFLVQKSWILVLTILCLRFVFVGDFICHSTILNKDTSWSQRSDFFVWVPLRWWLVVSPKLSLPLAYRDVQAVRGQGGALIGDNRVVTFALSTRVTAVLLVQLSPGETILMAAALI